MSRFNIVAFSILNYWGYHNLTVGDLDGRNFKAEQEKLQDKKWYRPKDNSYKTTKAVHHAFRLAEISESVYTK